MKIQPLNSKKNRAFPEGGCSSTKRYRCVSHIRTNKVVPVTAGCVHLGWDVFTSSLLPDRPMCSSAEKFPKGATSRLSDGWPGSMIQQASGDTPLGTHRPVRKWTHESRKAREAFPGLLLLHSEPKPHTHRCLRVAAAPSWGPEARLPPQAPACMLTRLSSDQGGVGGSSSSVSQEGRAAPTQESTAGPWKVGSIFNPHTIRLCPSSL